MASLFLGLRRGAPRLPPDFFTCFNCQKSLSGSITQKSSPQHLRWYTSRKALPKDASRNSQTQSLINSRRIATQTPLSSLSQTITSSEIKHARSRTFFPETSSKSVAYWLLGSAASVFGIVVFGGLTRLTESG